MKSYIDVSTPMNRLRYDRILDGFIEPNNNIPPIYVHPGTRGVSIYDVKLKQKNDREKQE